MKTEERIREITSRSIVNCHCVGLDSVVINPGPSMRRVFITRPDHEMWKNVFPFDYELSVGLHGHHCDVHLTAIFGQVRNVWATPSSDFGWKYAAYRYRSAIREGIGGFVREPSRDSTFAVDVELISSRGGLRMRANQVHTVYVPKGEVAAWLVEEFNEDPNYEAITWSNADLERADFSNLYKPMSVERCAEILSAIGQR